MRKILAIVGLAYLSDLEMRSVQLETSEGLRKIYLRNIQLLAEETASLRDQIASLALDVQTSEAKIASQHSEINRLEEQLVACEVKFYDSRRQKWLEEEKEQLQADLSRSRADINLLLGQLKDLQDGNEKLLLASSADGLRIKELEKAYADKQGERMLAETRAHDASEEASRFRQSLIEVESAATIERQRLGAELTATIADRQVATEKCREQYDGRKLAEADRDALFVVLRTIHTAVPEPKSGLRVFGELWTLAHSFESDHHV